VPVVAKLYDGDLIIETRESGSKLLRLRFKSLQPNRKWERRSLGTSDVDAAIEKSKKLYNEYQARIEAGIPTDYEKSFGDICQAYKDQLLELKRNNLGKPSHSSYITIITKWLIPLMGKKPLSQIDEGAIADFEYQRKIRYQGEPPKSTINQHNVVLRAVLEYAAIKKYINRNQIPRFTVKDKGRRAKRRPRFMTEEVERLLKFLEGWEVLGKTGATRYKRQLLRCYIEFLYYTGCRPGKEIEDLRWRNIERTDTKLRVQFNHSKNEKHHRRITADSRLHTSLERLEILTSPITPELHLFRMFGGKVVTGFSEMFSAALTEAGMRLTPHGDPRTLYSLRHTFASEKILDGNISREVLCRHIGTSWQMLEQYYVELHDELYEDEFSKGDIDIYDSGSFVGELREELS
jgi:integrase